MKKSLSNILGYGACEVELSSVGRLKLVVVLGSSCEVMDARGCVKVVDCLTCELKKKKKIRWRNRVVLTLV